MVRHAWIALVLVLALAASAPGALVIDNFIRSYENLTAHSLHLHDANTATALELANTIGGTRALESTMMGGYGEVQVRINHNALRDTLYFSADAGTWGIVTADYGTAADLNANLAVVGNAFRISVLFADWPATARIRVGSRVGNLLVYSHWSGTIPGGIVSSTDAIVPFSAFGGLASFADVDTIRFQLEGAVAGDYSIEEIAVAQTDVPEPATLGLLAVGGVLLLVRRRRANRA